MSAPAPHTASAAASRSTHHTALVRSRHTSADLYTRRPLLPPAVSSFRHCAAISYDDFLEASGSSSCIIDLSCMGFVDVMQSAQTAIAQKLDCSQADICWVVQTHFEVAPGVPLSYTSCLSTPECVASLVLNNVFAQLEAAVLSANNEADALGRFPKICRVLTPDTTKSASSTEELETSCKRTCVETLHARNSSAASAGTAGGSHMHEDHASGLADGPRASSFDGLGFAIESGGLEEMAPSCMLELDEWLEDTAAGDAATCGGIACSGGSDACPDAAGGPGEGDDRTVCPAEPLFVRCGLEGVADGRTAVRAVMQQVVRSIAQHSAADAATVAEIVRATGDTAAEVVEQFEAAIVPGTAAGTVEGADGRSGSAEAAACAAHAAAPSNGCSAGKHECEVAGESAHAAAPSVSDGGRGSGVAGFDVGECERQCCVDGKEAMAARNSRASWQEGNVASMAGGDSRGDGQGRGSFSGSDDAEDAVLAVYHETLTRTLCAVLRVVSGVCYEASEEWRTGKMPAAQAPLPAAAAEGRRQEQVHRALTEVCAAHTLTMRDAGRVLRSMAVNQISATRKHFEVENAHIQYYRQLALSAEQRAQMAAWWHSWLGHKGTLDASAAAARRALDSLPDTLPVPKGHLSHICLVADGAAPPRTCATCAEASRCASPAPCGCSNNMHERHACSTAKGICSGPVDLFIGSGCGGCGGPVDEVSGVPLGGDAGGMCRAAEAVRLLLGMQDADGALSVSALPMHEQPGVLLDAEQLAWMCRKNLMHGCPVIDNAVLCQLAATQLRRQELYRWPAVLSVPLPQRM